jgi:hypothetical protein
MTPMRRKLIAIAVLLAAAASVVLWQQQRVQGLQTELDALREQAGQAAALREENERLTKQLKAATERAESDRRELVRLYAKTGAVRRTEEENARLKAESERLQEQARQPAPPPPEVNPFDRDFGPGAGARVAHARHWGYALRNFAANHQGQFPTTFAEAVPFLADTLQAEEKAPLLQAAVQLEIVFHGTLGELEALPAESFLLLRERQAWSDSQGRWCKAYGMTDGSATIHGTAENDFAKWEGVRTLQPRPLQPPKEEKPAEGTDP